MILYTFLLRPDFFFIFYSVVARNIISHENFDNTLYKAQMKNWITDIYKKINVIWI